MDNDSADADITRLSRARPDSPEYRQPSVRRWRVVEVVSKEGVSSRHVYGHDVTNRGGRVSSSIRAFDQQTMTITTRSGSQYKLMGVPGHCRIGDNVWMKWCAEHGVVTQTDVTHEYFDGDALFAQYADETGADETGTETN